jgi:hypothetical protein
LAGVCGPQQVAASPLPEEQTAACQVRYGQPITRADLGNTSEPPQYQVGNSPWLGIRYNSCQRNIKLHVGGSSDFYQFRWSRPGRAEAQSSQIRSPDWFVFKNAHARTSYYFKIQGCDRGVFGSSCTSWSPTLKVKT